MNKKSKSGAGKDKPKAKKLNINKDTVQSLSDDDLGKVQGGKGTTTAASCSNPCPATKLLCPHKTKITGGCPTPVPPKSIG
jgi:hypothetical protein